MSPRRSVVFVDHTAVMSGGERSLLAVATTLPEWDISVLLGAPGPLAEELRAAGVDVGILPVQARRLAGLGRRDSGPSASLISFVAIARWSLALRRELRRARPDVVVANSLKAGVATWIATRRSPVPFVWVIRDRLAPDYLGPSARRVLRLLLGHGPRLVIANSEATAATCTAAPQVVVIPPSIIPLDVAVPTADTPVVFAVLSRLAPWKGQDLAIRAFGRAFPDGGAELRIIGGPLFGEDDYRTQLEHLVASKGLGHCVSFTGHVDDVSSALEGVHVVLVPSVIPEPFGRSVVEAMSAGIPVIASNAGGPAEIVRHDIDGLLVDIADESSLVAAMVSLTDPARRARLASLGRDRARAYQPAVLAPRWAAALEASVAG